MKKILSYYYEMTVIPSIVLGSISGLGLYGIHLFNEGYLYITGGELMTCFGLFIVAMTAVDLIKGFVKRVTS